MVQTRAADQPEARASNMGKGTILVIDDEKDLLELVRYNLEKEQFDVILARNGEEGLQIARKHRPDVIILDIMMPGMDGLEVCRRLRGEDRTAHVPLIMLTARAAESDRVVGLEMGADDYVTKPFSPRELVARVRAVLRRSSRSEETPDVISVAGIHIDVGRHEVTCDGKHVSLTATEFKILYYLASRPGRVVSRDEIIDGAMDREAAVTDRTIDVHMTSIRKKLGPSGTLIETVRGFGYKLKETTD